MAKKHAEFQIFKTKNKQWAVRLRARNGEIQYTSEPLKTKAGALRALDQFINNVLDAESAGVVIQEGK